MEPGAPGGISRLIFGIQELYSVEIRIFYSWQSDLPNKSNRGLISDALEKATKGNPLVLIDRDTQGVPGSPDIPQTILEKIDRAQAFVADVSPIGQVVLNGKGGRRTCNPNVLIELGYAVKALGWERIILVLNQHFGVPSDLPFDLQKKRVMPYRCDPEGERAESRNALIKQLENGIATIVGKLKPDEAPSAELADLAIEAIEGGSPKVPFYIKKLWTEILQQIPLLLPSLGTGRPVEDEETYQAIENSVPIVLKLARVAHSAAEFSHLEAATALYRGFSGLLAAYETRVSGRSWEKDHDLHKFLGHEMFATFISFFVEMERWEILSEFLAEDLGRQPTGQVLRYGELCRSVDSLDDRNRRLGLRRLSLHWDLLDSRHTGESALAELVPMSILQATDLFLYLREPFSTSLGTPLGWRPWSCFSQRDVPDFLDRSQRRAYAEKVKGALGLKTLDDYRSRVDEANRRFLEYYKDEWDRGSSLGGRLNSSTIGSRD